MPSSLCCFFINLISGVTNAILENEHLIVAGKGCLEKSYCRTGRLIIVDNRENIAGVGIGSREDGALIGVLVDLHVDSD